jgi:NADH dehydrogenase (ubiquinone) 1 alpha subcomplex subunit 5
MKVSTNPHYTLTALYGKILRALTKMPQDAAYRKYTEQIVNDRLKAVQNVSCSHVFKQKFNKTPLF